VGKGTGLGLWICRGIVQTHDGQLRIGSQPGVGTTVSLGLPPEPHPKSLD
jgi:signal transduction histidine kinase